MDESSPFPSPRIRGVREQHYRAQWFVQNALASQDMTVRFRLLIIAVYPARAIVELMLEAAERQELKRFRNNDAKQSRRDFEETLVQALLHYHLIEKIRIHDFHRFGCIPPDPKYRQMFYGGPIRLTASRGAAVLAVPPEGPKVTLTGDSRVKEQRPLCADDGRFFDDGSGEYLALETILVEYLNTVPAVITEFEQLSAG